MAAAVVVLALVGGCKGAATGDAGAATGAPSGYGQRSDGMDRDSNGGGY